MRRLRLSLAGCIISGAPLSVTLTRMSLRIPKMLNDVKSLIEMFAAGLRDRSTLDELHTMIGDHKTWPKAHALFQRIRQKTLAAEKQGDSLAECQYLFEEVCAKTLYNLSGQPAPFDPDSPYWIIPNALSLARRMNIHESEITKIVAG